MFEIVVAYYLAYLIGTDIKQIGPFSTQEQCHRMTQFLARNLRGATVTECWYGPAISISREKK